MRTPIILNFKPNNKLLNDNSKYEERNRDDHSKELHIVLATQKG